MNTTGRLPSIAMLHISMQVRLTMQVEPPHAVNDSTGEVLGVDLHPEDARIATEHASMQVLRHLPQAVLVRLDDVTAEFLPPIPCGQHTRTAARRDCEHCDFRPGCIAIAPTMSRQAFKVEVTPPGKDMYEVRVQRKQIPLTIKSASTLQTLQGTTAEPGLIYHWKFPRFYGDEMRWLATYVALCRPPSLAQLHSVGMPPNLREILEGGPPEGIITRFKNMFDEKEKWTADKAERIMRDLGW